MIDPIIAQFYRFIAYPLMRFYWFVFQPQTQGTKIIIKCRDEIIFVKNTYRKDQWDLPGGGMKNSEPPEQTAKREALEELGVKLEKVATCGNFEHNEEYRKSKDWVLTSEVSDKKFVIDPKEIKEARWFKLNDISSVTLNPIAKKSLEIARIKY